MSNISRDSIFLKYCFLFFVAIIPFSALLTTIIDSRINNILLSSSFEEVIIVLLTLLSLIILARRKEYRNKFMKGLGSVFGISLLSFTIYCGLFLLIRGINPVSFVGFVLNVRFVGVVLSGALLGIIYKRQLVNDVSRLVVVCGVISVFLGIVMVLLPPRYLTGLGYDASGIDRPGRPGVQYLVSANLPIKRMQAGFRSPNSLGVYLLIPFALVLFNQVKLLKRNRYLVLSIVALGVMWSFSRGAWIGLLILIGWYVFVNRHLLLSNHKARIVLVLSVVVALLGISAVTLSPVGRSLLLHQTDNQADGSTELRLKSYSNNMRLFVSNPLGRGHGYASPAGRLSNNNSGAYVVTENSYIQYGLELGVVGLLLFVAFMVATWQQISWFSSPNSRYAYWSLLATIATIGLFIPIWAEESVPITWWALVSLSIGLGFASQLKHSKNSTS